MVDFGTYTCINWLRTLPHIRAWEQKYREAGLVVVGIQTPEFAFEQSLDSVRRALPRGVTLTISSDDSRFIYASISSLEEHLVWGSLLAAVVVMVFMRNLRAVIISALAIPASIVGSYVSGVNVANPTTGQVVATYGNKAHANIVGKTLIFSAIKHAGSIEWTCTKGTVDQKYRPTSCRP